MTAAAGQSSPARPPMGLLALAEGRAVFELAAFAAFRPLLGMLPRGDGHPVLVLPGFLASDRSTAPLRDLLDRLGYVAHGWGLGRNVRVDQQRIKALEEHLLAIHKVAGRKVSIIGWSLGGVFARELAKMHPQVVRLVITLGSPIADDRGHSNARPLFDLLNGRKPASQRNGQRFTQRAKAPPVPTTSILTRTDGVVHWRGSVQHRHHDHPQTENIEVHASHLGLGVNPSVVIAIADRLRQPEGEWKPFRPSRSQRWMFPIQRLS